MSRVVREEVSTQSREWGYQVGSVYIRKVHFRETVTLVDGRPAVTFDYMLRPGPATSTNALLLLDAIGLSFSSATGR